MLTVQDVMTVGVATVLPETPLKEVARILVQRGISGVVVVDADEHVLGVVSEADLIVKEGGTAAIPHRRAARILGESATTRAAITKIAATTAGQAMTAPPVTIEPDKTLAAAAAVMVERAVNRLPVTRDGRLVGIVSRADLIRAYVRSDEQLAETIRTDLLLRHMLVDPRAFDIVVRDGVVHIKGQAETRSVADVIIRLIAALPGVIAVDANLTWALDDSTVVAPERDLVYPTTTR